MERRIYEKGELMPGAVEIIDFLQTMNIPLAIASSSDRRLIDAVLSRLGLEKLFTVIHSAEKEEFGKPHPAVFISTSKLLQKDPSRCLVLEDSLNGIIAAKAARMIVAAVPHHENLNDPRFTIADIVVPSLMEFGENEWTALNAI